MLYCLLFCWKRYPGRSTPRNNVVSISTCTDDLAVRTGNKQELPEVPAEVKEVFKKLRLRMYLEKKNWCRLEVKEKSGTLY